MSNLFETTRGARYEPKTTFEPAEIRKEALDRFGQLIDAQLAEFERAMNAGGDRPESHQER